MEVKYIGHGDCHPETCACDPWGLVDDGKVLSVSFATEKQAKVFRKELLEFYAKLEKKCLLILLREI